MPPTHIVQDEEPAPSASTARTTNVRLSRLAAVPACRIRLKVVPGSRQDVIAGPLGDSLKIRVSAPPEAGAANARVCELLAHALSVAVGDIEILSGHASAHKLIRVHGISASIARTRLGLP